MKPLNVYLSDITQHRLSQILYHCFENVESTKAALFLKFPEEDCLRLVTHYGWPRASPPPEQLGMDHPVVAWMLQDQRSIIINHVKGVPEVEDFIKGSDHPRLLISPILVDNHWVGILIQRDKSRGKTYEVEEVDLPTALVCQDIAETIKDALNVGESPQSPAILAVTLPPSDAISPDGQPLAPGPSEQLENYQFSLKDLDTPSRASSELYDASTRPAVTHQESGTARARSGMFMPEQRTYFWEAAALLTQLVSSDAISLWMDDDNQTIRPVLTYSSQPLPQELKQQALTHVSQHLNRIEERDLRIFTTVEHMDQPCLQGVFQTYLPVVLMGEGGGQDMMLLFRLERRPFTPDEQYYIQSVARMVGLHLQEIRLHERYHRSFLGVSHNLLSSVEGLPTLRDQSLATAKLARSFGRHLELPSAAMEAVCIAAILHDVGTSLLDPSLLHKPGLTEEEMQHLRTHPILATSFLKDLRFPFDVSNIIRHHHERWDGKGYPDGLKGEAIPLGSRIINLVESFSVMRLGNEFKQPKPMRDILEEIKEESGKQFDPNLVAEFMDYLRIRSSKGI